MASTLDALSSVSDSKVFSPFSLKHSMMFHISTISTEKKGKYLKYQQTFYIKYINEYIYLFCSKTI